MRMGGGGERIRTAKVSLTSALPEATDMLGKRASLLGLSGGFSASTTRMLPIFSGPDFIPAATLTFLRLPAPS
jgi:hypothetical protein